MKTIHIFLIFAVVILIQLYIPAKMIYDQEAVIKSGTAYKFKTQPIDPSDPFKGKYIHLNFELRTIASTDSTWTNFDAIYVILKTDSLGFAVAKEVSKVEPLNGDYVKAEVSWYNSFDKQVNFSLPFDEFYMNEGKAYNAEIAHAEAQRDTASNTTFALVYVLNGIGVIENVFINDVPIANYVEKEQ